MWIIYSLLQPNIIYIDILVTQQSHYLLTHWGLFYIKILTLLPTFNCTWMKALDLQTFRIVNSWLSSFVSVAKIAVVQYGGRCRLVSFRWLTFAVSCCGRRNLVYKSPQLKRTSAGIVIIKITQLHNTSSYNWEFQVRTFCRFQKQWSSMSGIWIFYL